MSVKTIFQVTGIIAAVSLPLLLLWIFGVPGVDNEYARGWKMGLNVLLFYAPAWLVNFGLYLLLRNRISSWPLISSVFALTILILSIFRMIQAFIIMFR